MSSWTPERIMETSRAFMESRILLTGAELNVFTHLCGPPKSLEEVAGLLYTSVRGTAILLDALAAMGVVCKTDGRYTCPPEHAKVLSADSPGTALPMLRHMASIWGRWSGLTDAVRVGTVDCTPEIFHDPEEIESFISAMHVIGQKLAVSIAERCEAAGSTNLLDVGGATGTYAEAFLRRYPTMRATIFDRPEVIELARKRLGQTDLMPRIALAAGNFYEDEFPGGHDLVLLSAIIHQNSPEQNVELYKKSFRALVSGGRILIRDHIMEVDRTQPPAGAIFAINMLVATASGDCYTFDEIESTLTAAGFTEARLIQTGRAMDGLIEAYKR